MYPMKLQVRTYESGIKTLVVRRPRPELFDYIPAFLIIVGVIVALVRL
jgi:hypothetical protein